MQGKNLIGGSYTGLIFKTTNGGFSPPTTPILISPANGSYNIIIPVTLIWNSGEGVIGSQLQVSTSSSFQNIVDSSTVYGTQYTIPSQNLQLGTTYHWRVRSFNDIGFSNWSTIWNFTTTNLLNSPILISPMNGTIVLTDTPTLQWETASGATNYAVQLSQEPNFISIVDSATITTNHYTVTSGKLYNNNVYNWRVKASNGNQSSLWSSVWYFTVIINYISVNQNNLPSDYMLYQNYPNPFNSSTKIQFDIPELTEITIKIYNINGQEIQNILSGTINPGGYYYTWNTDNISSGIYFVKLITNKYTAFRNLVFII